MNNPTTLLDSYDQKCRICSKNAHGIHFGVQACRACAAFFRRTTVLNRKYKCMKRKGACDLDEEEQFHCKYCRLKKCVELGMTTENVRLEDSPELQEPTTVISEVTKEPAKLINVANIIKGSRQILEMYILPDDESHRLLGLNQLQKLTEALRKMRSSQKSDVTFYEEIKFSEIFKVWVGYMEQASEWLMYCEEFRAMPVHEKIAFFKIVWSVWRRFERYTMSVDIFGQRCYDEKILLQSNNLACRIHFCHVDYSNISNFTPSSITSFFGGKLIEYFDVIVKPYLEMKFDLTETAYMLSQICWSYAARRLQGQTLEASEKFLTKIGNELHFHYQTEKIENYAPRIMKMMQIVNSMLNIQLKRENTMDVAMVFDFFNVIITEPEFFRV